MRIKQKIHVWFPARRPPQAAVDTYLEPAFPSVLGHSTIWYQQSHGKSWPQSSGSIEQNVTFSERLSPMQQLWPAEVHSIVQLGGCINQPAYPACHLQTTFHLPGSGIQPAAPPSWTEELLRSTWRSSRQSALVAGSRRAIMTGWWPAKAGQQVVYGRIITSPPSRIPLCIFYYFLSFLEAPKREPCQSLFIKYLQNGVAKNVTQQLSKYIIFKHFFFLSKIYKI